MTPPENYKLLSLTEHKCAKVDVEDYDTLAVHAWRLNGRGYAVRHTTSKASDRTNTYLHRQIMGCVPGDGLHIDHINRDKLDNRKSNLRRVSRAVNMQNAGLSRRNKTGVKGVSWHKGAQKYMANRSFNGRYYYCGVYSTIEEASKVLEALANAHSTQ